MEAKLNKIVLNYVEKTSKHLFARKFGQEGQFEYMKTSIVECNNKKIMVNITLNNDFSVKEIKIDDGVFYDYYDIKDGSSKHSVDTHIKCSIFGYNNHCYYSVPGKFKININGNSIRINEYIDQIVSERITNTSIQILRNDIAEKIKTVKWISGTYRKYMQPEEDFHLRIVVK